MSTEPKTFNLPAPWPDIDSIVTEDDEPVDNIYSEKQQRLLTDSLYNSYDGPGQGRSFVAMANVGLFYEPNQPPLVPDVMVSLDVKMPGNVWDKHKRSYFVSEYGKPPEVAIEIVSDLKGKEDGTKLPDYASAGIRYYIIFDPEKQLKQWVLRVYELKGNSYVRKKKDFWLPQIKLGLTLWEGYYEDMHDTWLRWCDRDGKVVLVGHEAKEREREAKERERKAKEREKVAKEQALGQLEQERQAKQQALAKAEQERQRAEHLAAKLRALGIEPD